MFRAITDIAEECARCVKRSALAAYMLRCMKPDTLAFYRDAVQRVVHHLLVHIDEHADLAQLAQLAGISRFHFHRVFRGMVGETPLELLRRVRLERAAWTLCTTSSSVTTVAFEAGFETHESFTRAFRAAFGDAPSRFRRARHTRPILASANGVHFSAHDTLTLFSPRDTGAAHMQIDIETLPNLRLATVAHSGPYNQIGRAFERLGALAGAAGLLGKPDALMVALYHDDPETTKADALRSHAGLSIAADASLPSGLTEVRIAGGRYARHLHVGPFTSIGDVWSQFLGEAIPAQGLRMADGPALEIYRSEMRSTPPEEFRTDMFVPVED